MEYSLVINVKKPAEKRKPKIMQEQLYSANMPVSPVAGEDLFITSGMIQPFLLPILKREWYLEPPTDMLWTALAEATKTLTGQEVIDETHVPLDAAWERFLPQEEIHIIFHEITALAYAVGFWLSPSIEDHDTAIGNAATGLIAGNSLAGSFDFRGKTMKRKNGTPAIDIDMPLPFTSGYINLHAFASYCLNIRSTQVTTTPAIVNDTLARVHQSKGLLPLAWMEIWYALDHDIKARVCPYCAKVFIPSPFHPRTIHCQGDECKKTHLIKQKGGPDGYRKWERERKQKRKNKKGVNN